MLLTIACSYLVLIFTILKKKKEKIVFLSFMNFLAVLGFEPYLTLFFVGLLLVCIQWKEMFSGIKHVDFVFECVVESILLKQI